MSRVDLRYLSTAFELTLDRRRHLIQFSGTAAALLVLELTARVTRAAQGPDYVGRLLAFPFFYVILMATAVVVCVSCRHTLSQRDTEGRTPFEPVEALAHYLLPSATGAAVLFLSGGAVALIVSLVLAAGKFHAVVLSGISLLVVPLIALLGLTVGLLAIGLLVFPPLAAVSGGDLDGLLSQFWQTLRTRFLRVLCQEVVALAVAALFTGMLLASLWAGEALLNALAGTLFGDAFHEGLQSGFVGLFHRFEWLLLWSAVATPALVFLNAASYLILSAPAPDPAHAAFDEEEETWLLP